EIYFFSSRRRHTRWPRDWSSDVCSSDLVVELGRQLLGDDAVDHRRGTLCKRVARCHVERAELVGGGVGHVVGLVELGELSALLKIGRASCRERGWGLVVAVVVT